MTRINHRRRLPLLHSHLKGIAIRQRVLLLDSLNPSSMPLDHQVPTATRRPRQAHWAASQITIEAPGTVVYLF